MNVDGEGVFKAVLGGFMTLALALVSWFSVTVRGNREAIVEIRKDIGALQTAHTEEKAGRITKLHVKEAIEEALDKRDDDAKERRKDYNDKLKLEIRQVVSEEINRCQNVCSPDTARVIEEAVKRAIRESTRG